MIWGERFGGALDDVHALRAEIVGGITAALEVQIPLNEALLAQGRPPENLDAWQAFHLGLKQCTSTPRRGQRGRRGAVPPGGGARARASPARMPGSRSCTSRTPSCATARPRGRDRRGAARAPSRGSSSTRSTRSSTSTWAAATGCGRISTAALPWLERATAISPNYAQGIYSRALIDTHGRPQRRSALAQRRSRDRPQPARPAALRHAGDQGAGADRRRRLRRGGALGRGRRAHAARACHHRDDRRGDATPSPATCAPARRWAATVRRNRPDADRAQFFDGLPVPDASPAGGSNEPSRRPASDARGQSPAATNPNIR